MQEMQETLEKPTHCADCHAQFVADAHTPGYATACADGRHICYDCSARLTRQYMIETGRATLYLTSDGITDWPGRLRFQTRRSRTHKVRTPQGYAMNRTDVWFVGPDGKTWHGVNQGDNEILRCKRNKHR